MSIENDHLLGENIGLKAAIKACLALLPDVDAQWIQKAREGALDLISGPMVPDDAAGVDPFKIRDSAGKVIETVFNIGAPE